MTHHAVQGSTQGSSRFSQEAQRVTGKHGQEPLLWFPWERQGKAG